MVRDDAEDLDAKRRSKDTANRVWTTVRAALNLAYFDEANNIATDAAWRRVKPFKDVARGRVDDLDAKQVRLLVAKAATFDKALANLCEAGYLTGARFGELAAASVRDLDAGRRTLNVDGKTGQRVVSLADESAEYLRRLTVGGLCFTIGHGKIRSPASAGFSFGPTLPVGTPLAVVSFGQRFYYCGELRLLPPLVIKRRRGRSPTAIAKRGKENAMGINEIDYTIYPYTVGREDCKVLPRSFKTLAGAEAYLAEQDKGALKRGEFYLDGPEQDKAAFDRTHNAEGVRW